MKIYEIFNSKYSLVLFINLKKNVSELLNKLVILIINNYKKKININSSLAIKQ